MFKVCTGGSLKTCKKFDSLTEIIEWAEEEINKIKVDDYVEVTDTGLCYTRLGVGEWLKFYDLPDMDIETYTNIIIRLNHESLGYSDGIHSISEGECTFRVVAEVGDKYIIEAIKGTRYFDYYDGYYIIGKIGVKKVEK